MKFVWRLSDWLRHRALLRRDDPKHVWGARGEDLAHRFLQRIGYQVIARNWRAEDGTGELDLVAWEGETLVIVEVKTRSSSAFGLPEEAVNHAKRDHLMRTAARFAREADVPFERLRFDIVGVLLDQSPAAIDHSRGAFGRPI